MDDKSVIRQFFETTSVKGISRAVKSPNLGLKILWLFGALLGIAIGVYWIAKLLYLYFSYATTTKISETKIGIAFPDVTACHLNPLAIIPDIMDKRREYIQKVNEIESTIPSANDELLARIYNFKHDNELLPRILLTSTYKDILATDAIQDSFILECRWDQVEDDSLCRKNIKKQFINDLYGVCYTMKATDMIDEESGINDVQWVSAVFYLNDFVDINYEEYDISFVAPKSMGIKLFIHPQGTMPDLDGGVRLTPGFYTTLDLSPVIRKYLPAPYSECQDDATRTVGDMHYSHFGCGEICDQEAYVSECGCLNDLRPATRALQNNYSYCIDLHPDLQKTLNNIKCLSGEIEGHCDCLYLCEEHRYPFTVFQSSWPHPSHQLAFYKTYIMEKPFEHHFGVYSEIDEIMQENETLAFARLRQTDLIQKNFLQVTVSMRNPLVTHLVDKPIMTMETVLAGLGGTLNLWIGISFITIVEILDLLIKICHKVILYGQKSQIHAWVKSG